MRRFAGRTRVTPERSRAEIERTLARYGADQFAYATNPEKAAIAFRLEGRMVRLTVVCPSPGDPEFTETDSGKRRRASAIPPLVDQAIRQRWRALLLLIKAKLEAVELGVTTVEEEFMGNILLPDGQTVGQHMGPQLAAAYDTGKMPPLLPWGGAD